MYLLKVKLILCGFLILVSSCSFSLPTDKEQILKIESDSAQINQAGKFGEFTGRVGLVQGTTHLTAAKAETQANDKSQIVLAIAFGNKRNQAHYWTKTDMQKPELHAYADEIRYYPLKHIITLIGNAKIVQGENSFSGAKISYDTVKQHVLSKNDKNEPTTIVIHSNKKLS